ncbi:hypothetical protein FWG76_01280 [Candidatus Saccharibacteria bacterium]|nr:hypothetical protein [Candidatus Saccharibacteria bacterium]
MKILTYTTESNADAKTGVFLRRLERLVCNFAYLVPNGWRCIAKMQATGDESPFWHIDVQGNKGGGSFAEAKMQTLEFFPKKAATGEKDILELIRMCESRGANDSFLSLIKNLASPDNITREKHEFIRDNFGITSFYGGVRIPYEDLIVEGDKINSETGEIRISFSGASAEQDLFFALSAFKAINDSFVELYPNTQGWLNLRSLETIPAIKLWLDILGIKEA